MNTLGWVFILAAILIIRAVTRGRVMQVGEDLTDAFIAIASGDSAELKRISARSGEGNVPDAAVIATGMGDFNSGASGTYKLGKVKSHVEAAANYFGPKHRIKEIGGYRSSGSVPNSDHPKGLALDFMTKDRAVGDSLAADLIANKAEWNVKYVIWNKRVNMLDGKGWHAYIGPSDHTDHVHASFKDRAITHSSQYTGR